MTLSELKEIAYKKYDVICLEDLADFRNSYNAFLKFFKKFHNVNFKNNQKLIFYSAYELEQEFLNHMQIAIAKAQIGNFFILICNPYDLEHLLEIAKCKYNHADINIMNWTVPLSQSKKLVHNFFPKNYDTLCALPFMSLTLFHNNVSPCCKFQSDTVDDIKNNNLNDIFFNTRMQNIRKRMLNGEVLEECSYCWQHETNQKSSMRKYFLEKYNDVLHNNLLDTPELQELQISTHNLCNFKCRICDSTFSSRIAAEEIKYNDSSNKIIKVNVDTSDSVFADIESTFKNITTLRILGGEPFIWPKLRIILEQLINLGYAKNIRLEINTNGSVYPDSLILMLHKFREVEISISLDTVGEKFEIQRGGNWDKVSKNVDLFCSLRSDCFFVMISPVINIQNLFYLDEIVEYAEQRNLQINWWYLENPDYLSIKNVTDEVIRTVKDKYLGHKVAELNSLAERITKQSPVSGKNFINYIDKLDSRRNQNFKITHNEIYQAMSK
jgi:molybdenum cofactor biosynthesis enzyme MoaA